MGFISVLPVKVYTPSRILSLLLPAPYNAAYGELELPTTLFATGSMAHTTKTEAAALIGLSIVVALYALELLLIAIENVPHMVEDPPEWWIAREAGRPYDSRTEDAVVDDAIKSDLDAFPDICVPCLFHDSKLSHAKALLPLARLPNSLYFCNEEGTWLTLSTNGLGFRSGDTVATSSAVAIVGDSFVEGLCVPKTDTISGQLTSMGVPTTAFGISGSSSLHQLAILKEYVIPARPQAVIWGFFLNDLASSDLDREADHPILGQYLNRSFSQGLIEKRQLVEERLRDYYLIRRNESQTQLNNKRQSTDAHRKWLIETSDFLNSPRNSPFMRFVKLWRVRSRILGAGLVPKPVTRIQEAVIPFERYERFREILHQAKIICDEAGIELYFLYIPARLERAIAPQYVSTVHTRVIEILRQLQINLIDPSKQLQQHSIQSLYPLGMHTRQHHYAALGYQVIADVILDAVGDQFLRKSKSEPN